MQMQNLKPKYEVYPMNTSYKQKQYRYVREELADKRVILKRVEEEVELPAGYELFTARGDSVHVSEEDLIRIGINPRAHAPLINEDTGDEIAPPVSLKRLSEARGLTKSN